MSDKTGIGWTNATWNPITGCSHVSDGCRFCYAETLTRRFADVWEVPDLPWTAGNAEQNVILHPERLDAPLRWRRPRMVFVNSMSDLFHPRVPVEFVARVFGVMARADRHVFQVLTKRPVRARSLLREGEFWNAVEHLAGGPVAQPLPNVWMGVSIESARHVDRADVLRETPAAHRFISAEPLLGPLFAEVPVEMCEVDGRTYPVDQVRGTVDETWTEFRWQGLDLSGIDWLIAGGESGGHWRERPERFLVWRTATGWKSKREGAEWIRDLRDACDAAGTAFMFKQWGGQTPKSGGRELDGRTHDWTPTPALVS